jgi:hypothetical protein
MHIRDVLPQRPPVAPLAVSGHAALKAVIETIHPLRHTRAPSRDTFNVDQ